MNLKEYERCAMRTANAEMKVLTEEQSLMLNGVIGLCGESGELLDMIKKHVFHGHTVDIGTAIKELGDIHWYWSVLCNVLDLNPDMVLEANVDKLRMRYPEGFSTKDSIERRDTRG